MIATDLTSASRKSQSLRASWKGYFRLGDVMMPVRLYGATRSISPKFVQLHSKDFEPVQRVTLCPKDGEQLAEGDILRAVEYEGKYIELQDDEVELHSPIERDIVVRQITRPDMVDILHRDSPYYLVPDRGGELAYAVLRQAFEKTGNIAIVTFLFYGRERLGAVFCRDGMLFVQTLRFYDDMVPRSEVRMPMLPQPSPAQVDVASQLLERYTMPYHAADYRDQQLAVLNEYVERKAKGLSVKPYDRVAADATPPDQVMAKMRHMLGEDPRALRA